VNSPLAYFITWTTYGTWLHGDARGSFLDRTFLAPDTQLETVNRAALTEDVVILTQHQRAIVDATLVAECHAQAWELHARNVRSNHVHIVVSPSRSGPFVRSRMKALASKALSDDAGLPEAEHNGRKRWWTEKGNIVAIENEQSLEQTIEYVMDLQ